MTHSWRKLGLIFNPSAFQLHPKLLTHAANPLPVQIGGDVYRIFFSGRDDSNRSSVGAVDFDIVHRQLIRVHSAPFLEHGPVGSFYADGVSIGNCYSVCGTRFMLFMGWQAPADRHWRGEIGRLVVANQLTLSLDADAPFMALNETDPVSLSYPWVTALPMQGYLMWYGSTLDWDAGNGEMIHVIKRATSVDGQTWTRHGTAVSPELGVAQAFSRPTVVDSPRGGYDMWFSYRSGTGQRYRIGYAYSIDGEAWQLDLDNAGIDVSPAGWDSDMIEYPFVFDHGGQRYMLYNGNGYGRSGFGLAILNTSE